MLAANAASKALRFGSFYLWVVAGVAFSLFSYVQVINAFKELSAPPLLGSIVFYKSR